MPQPQFVEVLELGTTERISAMVTMKNPGLGTPMDDDRKNGMGIVLEYADGKGSPRWVKPQKKAWHYTLFGQNRTAQNPDGTIPLVFGKINGGNGGFNRWTVNGNSFRSFPKIFSHPSRASTPVAGWLAATSVVYDLPYSSGGVFATVTLGAANRRINFNAGTGMISSCSAVEDFSDTVTIAGISVLDSKKNPVPGSSIIAQSGFAYPALSSDVPEPSAATLIGTALAMLGLLRKRT